jgi:hypothetical protein
MLENNCSEHASRMSAMENSSKNAGEILNGLMLKYNRYGHTRVRVFVGVCAARHVCLCLHVASRVAHFMPIASPGPH